MQKKRILFFQHITCGVSTLSMRLREGRGIFLRGRLTVKKRVHHPVVTFHVKKKIVFGIGWGKGLFCEISLGGVPLEV